MRDCSSRQSRRQVRWISVACAILICALIGISDRSTSQTGDEVLIQLPESHQKMRSQLDALMAVGQQSAEAQLLLASEAFTVMRTSGQERLGGMIERILSQDEVIDLLPAKLMLADLYQYQHRFGDALALLLAVENRASGSLAYWRLRANLYRIRGQLKQMSSACDRGARIRRDPWMILCEAELGVLRGDTVGAIEQLEALGTHSDHLLHKHAHLLVWKADLWDRIGRPEQASRYFRKALLLEPSPYIVDRLIQFQLTHEGADSAEKTLQWWRKSGTAPSASWQLSAGLIAAAKGNRRPANQLLMSMEQVLSDHAEVADKTVHWRELARLSLVLDPASESARAYASKNWSQQKEPIDAALLAKAGSAGEHKPTLSGLSAELLGRDMSGLHAELERKGWL